MNTAPFVVAIITIIITISITTIEQTRSIALLLAAHCLMPSPTLTTQDRRILGGTYLSNATCPIRPRLFHARFVVSRITVICNTIRHF